MFGPMLEVAIGLVFTYVLFAGLLSVSLESVATLLKLRSKALENGLINMLEEPRVPGGPANPAKGARGLFAAGKRPSAALDVATQNSAAFFEAVYNHPLVGGMSLKNRPSYVPAGNVASAIIYVLTKASAEGSLGSRIERGIAALPDPLSSLKTALVTIAQEAQGDVAKFKAGLETWYDSSMDRLSGSYKRFSQACTFVAGLLFAVACNVDSIKIVERLYAEPGLRELLVKEATAYVSDTTKPVSATDITAPAVLETQLKAVGVAQKLLLASATPIGWEAPNAPRDFGDVLVAAAGWFLTALAGMMGAGFWFGLLQKLINLRGAGPKPAKGAATAKPAND